MRQFTLALVAVLVCGCVCFGEDAAVDNRGPVLTVEVVNHTANGHRVVGDNVTVDIYERKELVTTILGKVGDDGKAMFENIGVGDEVVAVAHVVHDEMRFSGQTIALKPEVEPLRTRVDVYDVTYENSALSVKTHHLIVKPKSDSLLFTEYIQLTNTSDLAISSDERDSGGKAMVLKVSLPKGYKDFSSSSYFEPEALSFTEDGFYDTMAVPPGDHQIIFSYALDTEADAVDVVKKVSLPTANFVLFSHSSGTTMQGLEVSDGQVVLSDGTLAEYYSRNDLPAGAEVAFKIGGLGTSAGDKLLWIVSSGVFGAIAILAVLRLWIVKHRRENCTTGS